MTSARSTCCTRPPALRPNAAIPCSRPPSRRCAGSASALGGSAPSPPPPSCSSTTSTAGRHDHRPRRALLGMAHSLLCAAGRDIRGVGGWLRSRPLIFAGEASFALYLMHELVFINLRGALQGRPRADAGALVAVAGVAAVVLHL